MTVGALAIWGVFAVLVGPRYLKDRAVAAEESKRSAEKADVIAEAQTWVRVRLKDPYSAVFTDVRIIGQFPEQRVCGQVNAKNSFGAYQGAERFTAMTGWAYLGDPDREHGRPT